MRPCGVAAVTMEPPARGGVADPTTHGPKPTTRDNRRQQQTIWFWPTLSLSRQTAHSREDDFHHCAHRIEGISWEVLGNIFLCFHIVEWLSTMKASNI